MACEMHAVLPQTAYRISLACYQLFCSPHLRYQRLSNHLPSGPMHAARASPPSFSHYLLVTSNRSSAWQPSILVDPLDKSWCESRCCSFTIAHFLSLSFLFFLASFRASFYKAVSLARQDGVTLASKKGEDGQNGDESGTQRSARSEEGRHKSTTSQMRERGCCHSSDGPRPTMATWTQTIQQ